MLYVILSVCCSVIVAILIKVARNLNVNVQQLVLWNYPITVLLTYVLLNPQISEITISRLPLRFYFPLIILLPSMFIFIALAIKYSGIVKTDVAQRMSLFVPLMASFILFNEKIEQGTLLGVVVGLLAIVCSISWNKSSGSSHSSSFWYPLIVFLGMGVIDVLFKQVALLEHIPYITSMFVIFLGAMIFAFVLLLWKIIVQKESFDKSSVLWGCILGLFNFANIYFYMKAHRAIPDNPSIVFTSMNIGVIVVGSLVGILLFKERLSKINLIGLILAIVSIFLIAYM